MNAPRWNQRFLAGTRGQIISQLERDGLVQQSGVRRSFRKPEYAYDLPPEGEQLFPKAYGPLLSQVLQVPKDRRPPEEIGGTLREAGIAWQFRK